MLRIKTPGCGALLRGMFYVFLKKNQRRGSVILNKVKLPKEEVVFALLALF